MKDISKEKINKLTNEILNDLVSKIQSEIDPNDQHGQGDIWGLYCSHDWDELVELVADYMATKKDQIKKCN